MLFWTWSITGTDEWICLCIDGPGLPYSRFFPSSRLSPLLWGLQTQRELLRCLRKQPLTQLDLSVSDHSSFMTMRSLRLFDGLPHWRSRSESQSASTHRASRGALARYWRLHRDILDGVAPQVPCIVPACHSMRPCTNLSHSVPLHHAEHILTRSS